MVLFIVVLGAGPAGLMHAVVSLLRGHRTAVIEKREEACPGREYAVFLRGSSVEILKQYGIYRYLEENHLVEVYENKICVAIGDLEKALKVFISEFTEEKVIHHETKLSKIISRQDSKIDLVTEDKSGRLQLLSDVDLVINAEGSHSQTNALLGNRRLEILPCLTGVTAVFHDKHPSWISRGKNLAKTPYWYASFLYRYIFTGIFLNHKRYVAAANLFKIHSRYFVGFCFSQEGKKLEPSASLRHWADFFLCFVSLRSAIHFFSGKKSRVFLPGFLPLQKITPVEIRVGYAEKCSCRFGHTLVFIVGDALVTVDPSTESGCHTAIEASLFFGDILTKIEEALLTPSPLPALLGIQQEYDSHWQSVVKRLNALSILSRQNYSPSDTSLVAWEA